VLPPTPAALSVLTVSHKEDLHIFTNTTMWIKTVKRRHKASIGDVLQDSKNGYIDIANRSCLEILIHLWTEYGTLTDKQLQDNDPELNNEISGETLYEELIL